MLVDCFCTVTPCCITSLGNELSAMLTLFCTSTVAMSMSVPTSNVTVSWYVPDDDDVELMYSMPSTPFTCCSMGIPTVCAMVSALAPGYTAVTCTVGGVIEGYWSMGSTKSEAPPATISNSESTVANMGRSMKNFENFMTSAVYQSIIAVTGIPLRTLSSAFVT